MRFKLLLLLLPALLPASTLRSQDTLFNQSYVSSVYITFPSDSLEILLTDIVSDHYFMARFVLNYEQGTDTVENAGIRLRGNTSRMSHKKSFKISFNTYQPGRRYGGVKKINLNGEHNDPCMVREKLYYDLWNKAGLPPRRTSFVRLFINDTYFGLYTCLEEPDKDWLTRAFGENDGNLYKCTYPADLVYYGNEQNFYKSIQSSTLTGGRAYDLQTNEDEDDYTHLVSLIAALGQPASEPFKDSILKKLNVGEVLKAYAFDIATGNWDDYAFNKNNYFLYDKADGQFSFMSYDPDNTFGVDWFGIDWATRDCLKWYNDAGPRPLITRLLEVPEFVDKFRMALDTMARYIIHPDSVFPGIDRMMLLIEDAAIADTFRTLDYGYTVSDFYNGFTKTIDSHTPYGIKPFIEKRREFILKQLLPDLAGNTSRSYPEIVPNPVHDKLRIDFHESGTFLVRIFSAEGRLLSEQRVHSGQETDVSFLLPGAYIVHIRSSKMCVSRKILKV